MHKGVSWNATPAHTCMKGLYIHVFSLMDVFHRKEERKKRERQRQVREDDNISCSHGWPRSQWVAASPLDCVSTGHLAPPLYPVSKYQASGSLTYSHGDSISAVVVKLRISLSHVAPFHSTVLHPPGCGSHSSVPGGNTWARPYLFIYFFGLSKSTH